MGGTEYLDDLLLDSTDAEGKFRLQVPAARIDSFIQEYGFLDLYRFGLEARSVRSGHERYPYQGYNIIVGQLPIDTGFNFFDRNDIDRHTLILTGKNERIKKDMEGMVIRLYRIMRTGNCCMWRCRNWKETEGSGSRKTFTWISQAWKINCC